MPEYGPAGLLLHLLDQHFLKRLESFETHPSLSLVLIVVFAFMDEQFLERSDVFLLQLGLEYLRLELLQFVVVQVAVLVFVADPEHSEQSPLVFRLQLFVDRVEQGRYREEHRPLSAVDHVDQVHVAFCRALDAHFHLLELHEVGREERFQVGV